MAPIAAIFHSVSCWPVAGGWWTVAGGWWLVAAVYLLGYWLCYIPVVYGLSADFRQLSGCQPLSVGCWLLVNTCWICRRCGCCLLSAD